ncbi:MAG TPA: outer membrane protein assembly factor BamB [Sedimenticola thiotaurini]|uniref:Outer membrane protein assembly factor BamB n=1 Tax=Sedimenticola thiotaurini TaxID=1543721 RepID=A0A831W649_9GAMM|nr:outer membrane protein assembly factor BamB [Sedimenticola thiotaurini]
MRIPLTLFLGLLLTGCSSLNPIDWLSPDEVINPPSELVDMENRIGIRMLWQTSVGNGAEGQLVKLAPHYQDGRLYVASHDGLVEVLEAASGSVVWKRETGLQISGGPGVGDGLVLLGSIDGELLALDADTGEERWRARVSSEVLSIPRAGEGVVVVHTVDGKLFGLDAEDGSQRWLYDRSVPVLSLRGSGSPVISDGMVIAGFASGKLVALNLDSGDVVWEVTVTAPRGRSELERMVDIDGDPLVVDGVVYVASYNGELAAVSQDTGVVLWRRPMPAYAGAATDWVDLYITDSSGEVWALDPQNGAALWKNKKLKYRRLSAPAVLGDYVLVGDFEGYVHWLSREDGRLLARIRVGSAPISNRPLVVDDVAYVYGDGGALAALAPVQAENP